MKTWILLGMMGSGKSTVGQHLALATGRTFADTDQMLQKRLGRTIPELFRVYGETAFRDHEASLLRSLSAGHEVLATGGGIVLRETNWVEFRRLGLTIFLDVELSILLRRLERGRSRRPLLAADDWQDRAEELWRARLPLYSQADLRVPIGEDDVESVVQRMIEQLETLS